jgi:hypothetical protein
MNPCVSHGQSLVPDLLRGVAGQETANGWHTLSHVQLQLETNTCIVSSFEASDRNGNSGNPIANASSLIQKT